VQKSHLERLPGLTFLAYVNLGHHYHYSALPRVSVAILLNSAMQSTCDGDQGG
jgi:hypothetical protein